MFLWCGSSPASFQELTRAATSGLRDGAGGGGVSRGDPRPATSTPGRSLEQIITDSLALSPGIDGGGGITFDPATGGFVSTSGAGDFGVGQQGGIADFNQSEPFGLFDFGFDFDDAGDDFGF